MENLESANNVNGVKSKTKRRRRKNRRLLVRVGITVFVVFSLLIVLLGFLIVHTASSSFFSGQQDTLRAQLMKARSTISDYRVFEWVAEFWDNYTDEMAQPTDMTDLANIKNSPMEEANTKEEAIRILEGYNEEEQMSLARMYTAGLAYLVKEDISQSGDLFILMDIREGKEATVYFGLPEYEYVTEMMGEVHPEVLGDDQLIERMRASSPNKQEVFFSDRKDDEGNYLYVACTPIFCKGEARYAAVQVHVWTAYHDQMIQSTLWKLGLLAAVLGIFGALLLLLISAATVGPVKRLRYGVRRYTKEKSCELLQEDMKAITKEDEFGELAVDITEMAEEIDRYMDENIRLAGEREAAAAELQIASRVQADQLPASYPESPYFTLQALIRPAKEVGGDFYDFCLLDETHLLLLIADVSDKGMNAAFFMAISKAMIKASAMKTQDPVQIITEAEQMLTENNPGEMFVTTWLAVIDLETGHVDSCNAGHDYPAIRRNGRYEIEKTPHGPAVSFLPGVPHVGYSFDLEPGDRLFLYTDGVIEALGAEKERFGVSRLEETLNALPEEETAEGTIQAVIAAVDSFAGDTPQFDDITMLCFTYQGARGL